MSWQSEFDRRKAAGEPKRWMPGKGLRPGEWQISDRFGNFFRRNGKPCCGCGHNQNIDYRKNLDNNVRKDKR